MIAIDLSKQRALDAKPKAIQQINFIANVHGAVNTTLYFILEEAKETVFELLKFCKYNFAEYKV